MHWFLWLWFASFCLAVVVSFVKAGEDRDPTSYYGHLAAALLGVVMAIGLLDWGGVF